MCSFFTIRDVIKQYHPMALRFFLVSSQYRAAINYTQRSLESVSHSLHLDPLIVWMEITEKGMCGKVWVGTGLLIMGCGRLPLLMESLGGQVLSRTCLRH